MDATSDYYEFERKNRRLPKGIYYLVDKVTRTLRLLNLHAPLWSAFRASYIIEDSAEVAWHGKQGDLPPVHHNFTSLARDHCGKP